MEAKGFLLGPNLHRKIVETIAAVEGDPYESVPHRIPTDLSNDTYVPKTFRIATFTGSWSIGTLKTVTLKATTTTPNTVSVMNLVCGLSPSAACDVSIAKDGTAWYLIQPNLTQQPGYSATGTQVLTVVNGSLRWVGTTVCS